ncbi:hypothetical protein CEXT_279521 [Caerostris extrusa]|uniref:Uncharacterized protein n=1 Tax=Caerostris extrusa TaxID=172846 RepID=A0AAV4S8R7_CAEEX|nr:hypothetical protein CEXT_279521 [Caerostris extrusa]
MIIIIESVNEIYYRSPKSPSIFLQLLLAIPSLSESYKTETQTNTDTETAQTTLKSQKAPEMTNSCQDAHLTHITRDIHSSDIPTKVERRDNQVSLVVGVTSLL